MWRSRSNSNLRIHNNSSSIFSCSSFKDIQNLYYDDDNSQSQHIPNPTPNPSPRPSRSPSPNPNPNPSVFHRVRLANSVVRAFSNRPLPHPVPISEPVLDTVSELPAESKPSPAREENAVTLHVSDSEPLPGHVSDSEPELPAGTSSAPAIAENVAKEPVPEPVTVLELEPELPLERYASENVIKQQESKISIPGAEKRVVVYLTSLRVVRSTFEDCRAVQSILRGFRVTVDERDLSMDSSFLGELQRILGHYEKTKLTLPRVFIGGRYIGGADEVITLHETGELKKIVQGLPAAAPGVCEVCGGYRFILCDECNGSHKCFTESGGFRSCTSCIENGLIRCPSCACEPL